MGQLSQAAELFYRRLVSVVDDYGRYYAHESMLLSDCYPLRPAWADVGMIAACLAECQRAELIIVYEVSGNKYLEISNFGQRVRAGQKSKFPASAEIRENPPPISAKAESEAYAESEAKPEAGLAGCAKLQMPPKTIRNEYGRETPNPAWMEVQSTLRASREKIARARDPVAYERAILKRVLA